MKKQKISYQTEEQNEMVKFLIVLGVVIFLILGVFFLSKLLIKDEVKDLAYQTGEVATNKVIVGTMLKGSEKEYYVLAYDSKSVNASAHETYAKYYTEQKESEDKPYLPIYYLDLSLIFNKNYYVTEASNPKATKLADFKMLDGTLLKIKNGKVIEYSEGLGAIANKLKVE